MANDAKSLTYGVILHHAFVFLNNTNHFDGFNGVTHEWPRRFA